MFVYGKTYNLSKRLKKNLPNQGEVYEQLLWFLVRPGFWSGTRILCYQFFYSGYSTPSRGRILLKVSSASLKLSQIGFFHPWRTAAILLLLSPCIALRRGFSVAHPLYILIITHILYVVYRKIKTHIK